MPDIPIYFINLASAPSRRTVIEQQLKPAGLEATGFEAATRRHISAEDRALYCNPNHFAWLVPAEAASRVSHFRVWREMVKAGQRDALILEDDAGPCSPIPALPEAFAGLLPPRCM